jgi:hypothetical protein
MGTGNWAEIQDPSLVLACSMKTTPKSVALVLLGMVAGCAAAAVAPRIMVPPVRAGTSPTRWEHTCTTSSIWVMEDQQKVSAELTRFGREGWELVTSVNEHRGTNSWTSFCFKRALPASGQ